MTAPIPAPTAVGTGLKGDWLLGSHGGVRVDLGVTPRGLSGCSGVDVWEAVRDLLTAPVANPGPLEAPRRWRPARGVSSGPAAHGLEAVLADADGCLYSAPAWVLEAVAGCAERDLGVLVVEDTHHHQDVLVVRQRGDVVAFVGVRRLEECAG